MKDSAGCEVTGARERSLESRSGQDRLAVALRAERANARRQPIPVTVTSASADQLSAAA